MKIINNISYIFVLVYFFTHTVNAQDAFPVKSGEILYGGYDPVSYFSNKPVKGNMNITVLKEGRKILFSSEENKNQFLANPKKFEASYGGWCAIALVSGDFVVPDYTLYKIQNDQLLFFTVRAFFNGLTLWEKNPDKNLLEANKNYANAIKRN